MVDERMRRWDEHGIMRSTAPSPHVFLRRHGQRGPSWGRRKWNRRLGNNNNNQQQQFFYSHSLLLFPEQNAARNRAVRVRWAAFWGRVLQGIIKVLRKNVRSSLFLLRQNPALMRFGIRHSVALRHSCALGSFASLVKKHTRWAAVRYGV